jgi:hypothetical protein
VVLVLVLVLVLDDIHQGYCTLDHFAFTLIHTPHA